MHASYVGLSARNREIRENMSVDLDFVHDHSQCVARGGRPLKGGPKRTKNEAGIGGRAGAAAPGRVSDRQLGLEIELVFELFFGPAGFEQIDARAACHCPSS